MSCNGQFKVNDALKNLESNQLWANGYPDSYLEPKAIVDDKSQV